MKPGLVSGWLLYPILGPPLGAAVLLAPFGYRVPKIGPIFVFSYVVGGAQALLVGIAAGAFGHFRHRFPIMVPVIAALVGYVAFVLEEIFRAGRVPDHLGIIVLLFFVHVVPAVMIWGLVELSRRLQL